MSQTEEKKVRAAEIQELIAPFALEYMVEETYACALKLLSKLTRKRTLDIRKGKKEIWAGAVVYVIARLNFMFDKEQDYWVTADEITDFFGIKKSTVGQKATLIEKSCSIGMMDEEFTRVKMAKMFSFKQLISGFIVPVKGDVEDYEFSEDIPEEVAAHSLFAEAALNKGLKPPRKLAWEAEKKAKAELKENKLEKLAAEETERKRIEFDRVQPSLFD